MKVGTVFVKSTVFVFNAFICGLYVSPSLVGQARKSNAIISTH